MLLTRLKIAIPLVFLTILVFFLPGLGGETLFAFFAAIMMWIAVKEILGLLNFENEKWLVWLAFSYSIANLLCIRYAGYCDWLAHYCVPFQAALSLVFVMLLAIACFRRPVGDSSVKLLSAGILTALMCQALNFIPKLFFAGRNSIAILEYNELGEVIDSSVINYGSYMVFFMVLVTKMADVGAYALGSASSKRPGGNHKLAPMISPGKSWEGLLGGILAGVISAAVVMTVWSDKLVFCHPVLGCAELSWYDAIALGILLPVVGLVGDLMESLLKRTAGVKDSGSIPGLGGILDILDSLITCAPFFYLWMLFRIQ